MVGGPPASINDINISAIKVRLGLFDVCCTVHYTPLNSSPKSNTCNDTQLH